MKIEKANDKMNRWNLWLWLVAFPAGLLFHYFFVYPSYLESRLPPVESIGIVSRSIAYPGEEARLRLSVDRAAAVERECNLEIDKALIDNDLFYHKIPPVKLPLDRLRFLHRASPNLIKIDFKVPQKVKTGPAIYFYTISASCSWWDLVFGPVNTSGAVPLQIAERLSRDR